MIAELLSNQDSSTKPGPIKDCSSHSKHSTSVYCYNCSRRGHFGYECSEKRMQGNMFPTSPFIYCYDNEYDIKRRENRLKRKVADLQEAGLLPKWPEAPWQEEQLEEHSHRKRSKHGKELRRRHSRDGEQHKRTKVSRGERPRGEKHRKGAELYHSPEEDFPRGCGRQEFKASRVHHKSLFQAFSRDTSPDHRDNLFLIKQRRKKSRQKSW
ncbi:PREDICTED: zinc finger CCHC domain-containing protein 7-like [Acanthisitta chloris]|uniref:zinc finger CCHC domain-containing protein 7-like n=1 Tax=Acanthisitta chloris TaxID=57068 RepID=UPI0004F0F10B|nr:PREDICTED: zinc finger CCHC domain-containing protein 7-like [Acanthisitta chloris]